MARRFDQRNAADAMTHPPLFLISV